MSTDLNRRNQRPVRNQVLVERKQFKVLLVEGGVLFGLGSGRPQSFCIIIYYHRKKFRALRFNHSNGLWSLGRNVVLDSIRNTTVGLAVELRHRLRGLALQEYKVEVNVESVSVIKQE